MQSLVAGTAVTIQLPNPSTIQAIKLSNSSPFDLTISGFGTPGVENVPNGTEYMLDASVENTGSMSILPVNNAGISGNGYCNLTIYYFGENVPKGTWPITIPVQIVQAKVSTVTTLINDGNALGTQIIESTPSGAPGSTISVLNDGTVAIKGDVGGVLTALLSLLPGAAGGASSVILGDTARTVEALGKMLVDGALQVNGDATLGGAGTGLAVTNNETVGGTLGVTGASTFTGDATFNGTGNSITSTNNIIANGGMNINTIRDNVNGNVAVDLSTGDGSVSLPKVLLENAAPVFTHNGSTSGVLNIYTPIWGSGLKIMVLTVSNYVDTGVQSYNFISAISFGIGIAMGLGASATCAFYKSGVQQTEQVITSLSGTGGGSAGETAIHSNSIYAVLTGATQVQFSTVSSAITGLVILVGV